MHAGKWYSLFILAAKAFILFFSQNRVLTDYKGTKG